MSNRKNIKGALLAVAACFPALTMMMVPVAHAKSAKAPIPVLAAKPNIIMIVLDDVGFSDLGAFGSEIRTPNIDALARDGLRYTRFDSKAVCTATRAALLTGRNAQTVRLPDLPASTRPDPQDTSRDRGELPDNAQLLPQVLHDAGYRTYGFGKWHLAPEYEDGSPGNNASWPLQRGFDQFYGFFLGWTDQYHPDLIEGNGRLPKPNDPNYHFSVDIVDRTIASLKPASDAKPAFVYLAFGAGHSPIQVPKPYIQSYAGVYDKGWDALRDDRLKRMKAMGIVPENTVLPERNPGDRAWDSLSPTEKKVYARFMEVYAAFITHTDEQIGRLVAHLKATGQYDNSMIVLISDNGAASEAGQKGNFEKMYRPNILSPEEMLARLDELGTDKTQSEYPRPWAMAGVTPLRRYKIWPYLGGVRTPLIISWPKGMKDTGKVRTQYVDTVDLAPTIADAAQTRFPASVKGRTEIPVAGKSIRASFTDAAAPSARNVQYFELRGNRAITAGDWRAVAMHRYGTPFEQDCWELFNTAQDFSETTNLAGKYPKKLKEMQALWWSEARKYSSPPLEEMPERFANRERFDDSADRGAPATKPTEPKVCYR